MNPVMVGMAMKGMLFFLKMTHFTYQLLFYISALKIFGDLKVFPKVISLKKFL